MKKSHWIIFIIVFVVLALGFWFANQNSNLPQTRGEMLNYTMEEHTNIELHIHPYIDIDILGANMTLPANIGIDEEGMHVIHTHDTSKEGNKVHIESPTPFQFYLGDLFTIWQETFNETCIFEHCINAQHTLKVYVNDIEKDTYQYTPLRDGDRIRIVYTAKR